MTFTLRKWTLDDQEALMNLCNAIDRKFLSNRIPFPYTLEDAAWWLNRAQEQEGKDGIFRAIVADDGQIIGTISVERQGDVSIRDGHIGYFLRSERWSKGIMSEAARQICAIAFAELDILRITGDVYAPNIASRRVLEKNGFALEGIKRNAVYKNGNVYDFRIYGKLR